MPRNSHAAGRQHPPTRVGSRPRFLPLAVAVPLAMVACQQGSNNQTTPPLDLGMTPTMTPYYQSQQLTLYEAQTPVALPVKLPSSSDIASLGGTPAGTPYAHAPWITADDEVLEVHYILTNIDSQQHVVWLLIDPWNEFVRYNPGIAIVNDEQSTPNYGYDLPFLLPAMSRVEGTITSDDMHEIAIKLASVQNLLASPQAMAAAAAAATPGTPMQNAFNATGMANHIMNPQNRSNAGDPLYTPWIPPVIAGLTGFDLGIRTTETANVAVEITIDVQDVNGNRFVPVDSTQPQLGMPPATLSPAGAKF